MRIFAALHARWRTARRDERGVALVIAAGSMLALTSVVALAVDVGMLYTARTEAQRAADASALAGAGALIISPDNEPLARLYALDIGGRNSIGGEDAQILESDVQVDLTARQVTVRALRTEERGNPVRTFFARVFGVNTVDIGARATAEATPAGGVRCLLPVAMPDRWEENTASPGNDPYDYNPEHGDRYVPWMVPDSDPPQFNPEYTGYSEDDIGVPFTIKSNSANGGMNPSWYYPWRPPGQSGAADYRENVRDCVDPSIIFWVGQDVDTEPGNMSGPTMQGFRDLIDLDPSAAWNDLQGCVVDRGLEFSSEVTHCRGSPRVRPIPLFDPTAEPDPGNAPFTFTNFAGI
ncbi:MAG: pilus assembly protein TadG-related protein, partial [Gemmatimonadota bacterium]|nr:pilus assembly protein TadG-related protein [Gemmatimonadota bacterium]